MNTFPSEWSFSCSSVELFTLASLLGGEMLVGVSDPFPGWLKEEIEEAMQLARQGMVEHSHLILRPDGQMVMDTITAALVGTLVAPQAVFLLTMILACQSPRQLAFYHRAPLTVVMENTGEELRLRSLSGIQQIFELIQETWQVGEHKFVQAGTFSLQESVLQMVQKANSSDEMAVQRRLEEAGLSITDTRILARSLTATHRYGVLVAMRPCRNTWEVDGLGMLESVNGLWKLRSLTRWPTAYIELEPCSGKKLASEIQALLSRFLPSKEV